MTLFHQTDDGSSSAVNPALTAMANALRVGDHLLERLGALIEKEIPAAVDLRQRLHANPELGAQEHATAAAVTEALPVPAARSRTRRPARKRVTKRSRTP